MTMRIKSRMRIALRILRIARGCLRIVKGWSSAFSMATKEFPESRRTRRTAAMYHRRERSVEPNEAGSSHDIKQYWLVVQCGWIMGWVAPGGGGWTTMHCACCASGQTFHRPSHPLSHVVRSRARAIPRPSLRSLSAVLSVPSSCPLLVYPSSPSHVR